MAFEYFIHKKKYLSAENKSSFPKLIFWRRYAIMCINSSSFGSEYVDSIVSRVQGNHVLSHDVKWTNSGIIDFLEKRRF